MKTKGGEKLPPSKEESGILATVANVVTLLGLLGTVSGIIKTFHVVALVGLGNPAPLATGIAEALVATGGSLCVAIPALVAHRILRERAENLILMMEEKTARFLEMMPDYAKRIEAQRVLLHGVKDAVSKK